MTFSHLSRSKCVLLFLLVALPLSAATFNVTNTNDSGPGSLRQALLSANVYPGGHRIEFVIGTGPQTIQPLTNLPSIDYPITIDGWTQPGYAGKPIIEIDGSFVAGNWTSVRGLSVINATVRGLVINNFAGPGLVIHSGHVQNCYFGTDVTGTVAKGNSAGIDVRHDGASLTVGGSGNLGNLISGNPYGIIVNYETTTILGNTFGSNAARTAVLSGTATHIESRYGTNPISIGSGNTPNFFAGGDVGVSVFYGSHVSIDQNYFGGGPSGPDMPVRTAIAIYQASDNRVEGNVIKGSSVAVHVSGSSLRNRILGNSMFGDEFGIDLSGSYTSGQPTPNDVGDGDLGPNNFVNFPVLGRVTTQAGETRIAGTLSTAADRTHRIEIFSSPSCNQSGYGEGKTLIDAFDVTTDGSGTASFTRTLGAMAAGSVITATATSDLEGTSEFSPCSAVEGAGTFSFASASAYVYEGGSLDITVQRLGGAVGAASVSYSVTGGSATAADITGGNGTLTFADGETSKTLHIAATNDALYEGTETLVLTLGSPTNGTKIGSPASTSVTIWDDDSVPYGVLQDVSVAEGDAGAKVVQVPLTLSGPAAIPLQVGYTIYSYYAASGQDFIEEEGSVTFAPGETAKSVPVTIFGDTLWESDEPVSVALTSHGWTRGDLTILNDDPLPVVEVEDLSVSEGDANSTIVVTLRATQPVFGYLRVSLVNGTAQAPGDFVANRDWPWVHFNHETTQTVSIPLVGDNEPEPDEWFTVALTAIDKTFTVRDGTVTIVNDDVGVGPAERWIAAGTSEVFTIRLGQAPPADMTIGLASDVPSAIAVEPTIVIPAGKPYANFAASALVPGETGIITVTFPPGLGEETSTVRVRTYQKATLRFSPERVTLFDGQTATVSVSLDPPSPTPITIGLDVSDAVEATRTLTIPAGGSASFVITAKRIGTFSIDAKLPPVHGNEIQSLFGSVIEEPQTPAIVSLTPSHGPSSGGTEVRINGVNFRRECTVAFGGVPASSLTFDSATAMTAVTPPHGGGTVDVSLACGADSFILRSGFGYVSETPRVSTVTPSTGTTAGGTHVRVTGEHFDGSCWLFFGRYAATDVVVRDAQSITGATPPRPAGVSDVTVRCSGGTSTLPVAFTYRGENDPAPLITEITPAAAAPGELVTIHGLNFRPTDQAAIDTTPASIVDPAPESHVIRVPELPAGQTSVLVTDLLGRMTTSGPLFSILEARPPRITAVTPQSVAAGAEILLTGEGFRPGYTFEIGGHTAAVVTFDYTTAVVRVSPHTAPGPYPVNVRNSADALASIGPNVEIATGGLVVTSADPRCALTDGGVYATLRGRGFTSGATVAFDGAPSAEVTVLDDATMRVLIPAGAAGPAIVSVTNGTATTTLTNGFLYASPFDPRGCGGRTRTVRH